MARPFRHAPPELRSGMLLRSRVQSMLAGRFDRRVTVMRAGAGFGKTTAISQAFAENALAPLGVDRWLACEPDDADPVHFVRGVAVALDLGDRQPSVDDLVHLACETLGAKSPGQVCLALDDVQFLADSECVELLDRLIAELPSNAHLLLAGRVLPDVALTRLELIGDCAVVDEATLAFDPHEAAQLLGSETSEGVAEMYGGWPALVQLAGSGRAQTFVREEVLRSLSAEELDLLRTLAVLGECKVSVLDRMTGRSCEHVLDALPLVHRLGDRCAAHDLWSELLAPIGRPFIERVRREVAELLLGDDAGAEAVAALMPLRTNRSDALVGRCIRTATIASARVAPEQLRAWLAAWPDTDGLADAEVNPGHLFVAGLVARLDNPGSEQSHELLRRAAERFRAEGDGEACAAVLGALVYACHVRRDVVGLLWAFGELASLAEAGVAGAQPYPLLTGALVATSGSSPLEAVTITEQLLARPLNEELQAITLWLHANAQGNLGRNSYAAARACYEIGLPLPGMAAIYSGARWRAGMIRELLAEPTEAVDGERDRFLMATWSCCVHSALGNVERARDALDVVECSAGDLSQWQTSGSVRLPQATLAYSERRDDDAMIHLRAFLAETPRDGQGEFYRLFSIGLLVPLVPEEREWLIERSAGPDFGPLFRRDLDLALAATAIDEQGDATPVSRLVFPSSAGEMMPSVGFRNGAPLLAAAVGLGRDDLGPLLDDWVDLLGERARTEWRALFDHPVAAVATGARALVEGLPVRPPGTRRLSVLGTTELSIDGLSVDHADWRRERVRALLTHLVLNRDTTRDRVISALWPDVDGVSGRRSLRSTLNVLNAVLEPDRQGGDAPYFVRSSGQRLQTRLAEPDAGSDERSPRHGGVDEAGPEIDGLDVDVFRFEWLLDRAIALERRGTPSLSIPTYLEAVGLYRGDLLPDCYDDWVVFERDRLRSRYVSGGVRVGELLVAVGRTDEAIDTLTGVLAAEPWSEAAHRAVISAHLSVGDVASARRSLATCERRLEELGGPSDEATFELLRRLERR